jgi:hypothetical protein
MLYLVFGNHAVLQLSAERYTAQSAILASKVDVDVWLVTHRYITPPARARSPGLYKVGVVHGPLHALPSVILNQAGVGCVSFSLARYI